MPVPGEAGSRPETGAREGTRDAPAGKHDNPRPLLDGSQLSPWLFFPPPLQEVLVKKDII